MKYFVCLVILGVGAVSQNAISPELTVLNEKVNTDVKSQSLQLTDPFSYEIPETIQARDLIKENIVVDSMVYPPLDHESQDNPKPKNHKKHPHKDHHMKPSREHNQFSIPQHPYEVGPQGHVPSTMRSQQPQSWNQRHENGEEKNRNKHQKRSWNKKSIWHIFFWVVLAAVSFLVVRKCIKKRKAERQRRQTGIQNFTNPEMIDQEINKHISEIQILQQIKVQMQAQMRVQQAAIIYHQAYPQQMGFNSSNGRMINENSLPQNYSQQVPSHNIPVGVPVRIQNPFNYPQIYRQY